MDYPRLTADATAYARELLVRGYSDKMVINRLIQRYYFKDAPEVRRWVKFAQLHKEIDEIYGSTK